MWHPTPSFRMGLEYLYGRKETLDRSERDAHRLDFVVRYDLAGVLSRQKALMRRAKEQLRELRRERKQLLSEYTRVMTGSFANRSEISATTKAA